MARTHAISNAVLTGLERPTHGCRQQLIGEVAAILVGINEFHIEAVADNPDGTHSSPSQPVPGELLVTLESECGRDLDNVVANRNC